MAETGTTRKVFVSYSHYPEENAKFVRGLVQRLKFTSYKGIKFDVWLDEERIAGGGDVEKYLREALQWADAALFVVNAQWSERERSWIRMEVSLLEAKKQSRLVALLREDIDPSQLDHTFVNLKHLRWLPSDPAGDARFWEVYCGLTGEAPGARTEWEAKGKEICSNTATSAGQIFRPQASISERRSLPVSGKPVSAFVADGRIFLLTDRDEWAISNGPGEAFVAAASPCLPTAITVSDGGGLLIAGYDGSLARYTGRGWKSFNQVAPVLSFASCPQGNLAGTSSGQILLLADERILPIARMREPVVSMANYGRGVAIIGSNGTLARLSLPAAQDAKLDWIDSRGMERSLGFFQAVEAGQIGVMDATRVGVLIPDTEIISICPYSFEDGIQRVEFLGPRRWSYAVLTDSGRIVLVDSGLSTTRDIRLPGGVSASGCARARFGESLLVWTADGTLYHVSPQGSCEAIFRGDVILAFTNDTEAYAVHWKTGENPTVEAARDEWEP